MDITSPQKTCCILVLAAVLSMTISGTAAATTSTVYSFITISCSEPGKVIEAGQTATFDLTVENNGVEINRQMWYTTFSDATDNWNIAYYDGTDQINILALPTGTEKSIEVQIETSSDTPGGKYPVHVHIGDGTLEVIVTISKTHAGEQGTMEMTVVDNDGEKIKGAVISVRDPEDGSIVDKFMSTADGTVSAVVAPGVYTVSVGKTGYSSVDKKDVKIKGGLTTDVGTVMLDKALFAAEVTVQSPSLTTTASTNAKYTVSIKNSGKSDDTYRLSVEGAPSGWYFRFRESSGQAIDLSDVFIASGDTDDLTLEAIPPHGVDTGTYNFTMIVDSSQSVYTTNLTEVIRGDYKLNVYADQYQYDYYKGGSPLTFDLTLTNDGTAGALTNVAVAVTAPDGWNVVVEPETIAGIEAGEASTVSLRVVPPADISASEYKISVAVTSDQTDASDDFRIDVHEQSFIGIIGIVLIIALGAGILFMFRKYNRR